MSKPIPGNNAVPYRLAQTLSSETHVNPFGLSGTVFKLLLRDVKMYGLMAWMIFWLIIRFTGLMSPLVFPPVAIRYLGYFQYALTFVLTFFLNSTYSDFKEQGRTAASLSSDSNNLVFMVKVHLKHVPEMQERIIRLLNAAHYVSWMDLAGWYSWLELEHRGLLSTDEIGFLSSNDSKKHPQIMLWVLEELSNHYRSDEMKAVNTTDATERDSLKDIAKLENAAFFQMQAEVMKARAQFSRLFVIRSVPVPLIYTHMLAWFLMTFLMILGFYAGVGEETYDNQVHNQIWWIAGYVIVVLAFLALYDVAMALREPFGTDVTDIDPLHTVESTITSNKIFYGAPTMLASEQSTKPTYNLFHKGDKGDNMAPMDGVETTSRPPKDPPISMRYRSHEPRELRSALKTRLSYGTDNSV